MYCSSTRCCSCSCRCCCYGRCSGHEEVVVHSRDGSHPSDSLVERNCWSSAYGSGYVCLMGRTLLSHGNPDGISPPKNNKCERKHISVHTGTFWYGTTHWPAYGPARQIHGPAHENCRAGPYRTRVSSASLPSYGPGRAGPWEFGKVIGLAGPRPVL